MLKISEIIVVEGQNDINKVSSCIHCDCVKTNGTHLSQSFLEQLKTMNKTRGVIVMTDDDYPGRWIRSQIQEALGECKHAYIDKSVSRTSRKVGIEHASCQSIVEALNKVSHYSNESQSISKSEYVESGLVTNYQQRNQLIKKLGLPPMNSKRFFKVLNMMNISLKELLNENHISI